VPVIDDTSLSVGYPNSPPQQMSLSPGTVPCVRLLWHRGGVTTSSLVYLPSDVVDDLTVTTAAHVAGSAADRVSVSAGAGVLAADLPAEGASARTEYLITETGVRYPLASPDVAGVLGYGGVTPVAVPGQLLGLLVTGPVLSTAAALTTQRVTG
jgi:hypothetical protein